MATKPRAPFIGQVLLYTKNSDSTQRTFDLKGALVSAEIFEGLNQPQYSSQLNLTILDPDNKLYPEITGQEIIVIGFRSALNLQNENYIKVFQTIDVDKFIDDQQRQCITIYCVNPYSIIGKLVYFSKVFPSISSKECLTQCAEVVEKGFSKYNVKAKYEKDFEDSLFSRPLNVPSRNFEWVIDYWVHNSVAAGDNSNGQLFYFWDDNKGLHFRSNRSLLKENVKHTLFLVKNQIQPIAQHGIISRFEIQNQTSTKKQIKQSTISATVFDMSTSGHAQESTQSLINNQQDSLKTKSLKIDNDLIGQSKNRVFVPINYATEWKLMGSQMNDTSVKTNISNIIKEDSEYTTFALAEVPGDVNYLPGELIQIVRIDRNGNIDKQDQQIWMIRSIKHTLNYQSYTQVLELMR